MSDLLAQMAESSHLRAEAAARTLDEATLVGLALERPTPPRWEPVGFGVIAEVKLRAPSAGRLAPTRDPCALVTEVAKRYANAGASAVSVLTEPQRFDGALDHAEAVAQAVSLPVMRKDFLVAPYQIWEARLVGASGVLLIARMLDDANLVTMLDTAAEAGLFVLLECFDQVDVERARGALSGRSDVLVGVNTRDLRTLEVVEGRLEQWAPLLPRGVPWVAESGMTSPADVARAASLGYQLALVGTALMRALEPEELLREMLDEARAVYR